MEELPSLDRTPRISTSVGRLCDQPAEGHQLLPQPVSGLDIQVRPPELLLPHSD